MIYHISLGQTPFAGLRVLVGLVKNKDITVGGHRPGKIYGLLNCKAGKRMKPQNRVFFRDEDQAIEQGYRPCALCLPERYIIWKRSQ